VRFALALLASLLLLAGCGTARAPEPAKGGPVAPAPAVNADTLLAVEGQLVPGSSGQGYLVRLAITNKTAEMVQVLYDCGRPFFVPGEAEPAANRICPAIYSSGLEANATRQFEGGVPPSLVEAQSPVVVELHYETKNGGPVQRLLVKVSR
jgi:hypothetical protein